MDNVNDTSSDEFLTIRDTIKSEYKVKKSIFIVSVIPITNDDERAEQLACLKEQYPDATHHVWASRVGTDGGKEMSSDAGEPPGSAGKPILNTLKKYGLTNCMAVVVRYFGGKKLGIPGLREAYAVATERTIQEGQIITSYITTEVIISVPYKIAEQIEGLLMPDVGKVIDKNYGKDVELTIQLRQALKGDFMQKINNLSAGQARFITNNNKGEAK